MDRVQPQKLVMEPTGYVVQWTPAGWTAILPPPGFVAVAEVLQSRPEVELLIDGDMIPPHNHRSSTA